MQVKKVATEIETPMGNTNSVNEELQKRIEKLQEELDTALKRGQAEASSMTGMNRIIQEKQIIIDELKENSEFVDKKLEESEIEINHLKCQVKDQKKELEATQKSMETVVTKYHEAEKERQKCTNESSSSRQEISQLLYLNNQLKINIEQLEMKAKEQCAKCILKDPQIHEKKENKKPDLKENLNIKHAEILRLCYREVKESGSCSKKSNCNFSHDIPEEVKQDKERVINIIGQKNLCVNEYNKQGSCDRKEKCGFHHVITDEQRQSKKS